MKSIYQIKPDIYQLMNNKDGWFTDELAQDLGSQVATRLRVHFNDTRTASRLRLSKLGASCPRAFWYSFHHPEMAEPLPPQAMLKYSYGHILEAQLLSLAKAAGHEVTGEQDEVSVDGVTGHRDCVLDGCICDIKSVSSYGFEKFQEGTLWQDDPFGYLEQLDGYICGSLEDPLVRVKDKGYILAIDKTLGHIALYEHQFRGQDHIRSRIRDLKHLVALSSPPDCHCGTKPYGKSGNVSLDVKASYSPYKHVCFPNLRTFIYSSGPVYLARVEREPSPDILELDRDGNQIHRH